ncbi:hypothetical protein [Methylobacterium sp. ARG-1]|uniref:hypothetical protein n=1 Tax=Methylobacterium sp. ARG-1 TaxID=1692501 RepID=UPI000682319E|nr:hypothetical protein [Methylobacterium sp. ARG-1]KNY24526.1 hypothetical protein AKJ13_00725 [Methylobacterium sp. ARG-1]
MMTSQRSAFIHSLKGHEIEPCTPCLFEVEHGDTVIRIADDWDGHVLIDKLYVALREARQARDKVSLLRKLGPTREDKLARRPLA